MKILLMGYGTVGSGVFELIQNQQQRFFEEYDQWLEVVGILVKDPNKYAHLPHHALFTHSFEKLVNQPFDVAIETIGGISPAYEYVNQILSSGRSVITSNKDLIAEKGLALHETANSSDVTLSYEASVGGGIPVLKPIRECLAGDYILEISGIINGTTNFILTKMNQESLSYESALKMAQEAGFAESDPTSDVMGYDAVRKISILTKLGMGVALDWKSIPVEGITNISAEDVAYMKSLGLSVKLMGISKQVDAGLYTCVRPVAIASASKYASIVNEYNAITVIGESVGELFFTGKGAGKNPTATAVLGDLMDLLQNKKRKRNNTLKQGSSLQSYPLPADWILRDGKGGYLTLQNISENELLEKKAQMGISYEVHYLMWQ